MRLETSLSIDFSISFLFLHLLSVSFYLRRVVKLLKLKINIAFWNISYYGNLFNLLLIFGISRYNISKSSYLFNWVLDCKKLFQIALVSEWQRFLFKERERLRFSSRHLITNCWFLVCVCSFCDKYNYVFKAPFKIIIANN